MAGCRFWIGAFTGKGAMRYGILNWGKKRVLAHRLQYARQHGRIPKGLVVRHLCHQPRCVEPSHLAIGTHRDNSADSVKDGRLASGDRSGSRLHPESRPRGDKHPFSCAKDSRWKKYLSLYLRGRMNSREIAAQLGCEPATVNVALRGESRRHLGKINRKVRNLAKRGHYLKAMKLRRVFDGSEALQLLRLRDQGLTYAAIAQRHKCSQTAVWNGIKRAKALMKAAESKAAR
jgi:DNA-binding CsgD family transcriptional regulator